MLDSGGNPIVPCATREEGKLCKTDRISKASVHEPDKNCCNKKKYHEENCLQNHSKNYETHKKSLRYRFELFKSLAILLQVQCLQ